MNKQKHRKKLIRKYRQVSMYAQLVRKQNRRNMAPRFRFHGHSING
jgi:hypothetical protein